VQPRLCRPRRPTDKGGVERANRYLHDRFFAARTITSIEDGNRQLLEFIRDIADVRPHPQFRDRTVAEVFAEEKERLLSLPVALPETFSGALGLIHSRRLSRSTSSRSQSTGGGGIVIHTTPPEVIGEARPTHADMRSELRSLALCPRSGRRGFLSARSSPGVARTHRAPCRRASRSKLDERHAIDQAAPRCAELRRHAGSELSRSPRRRYADAPAPQPPGDRGTLDP